MSVLNTTLIAQTGNLPRYRVTRHGFTLAELLVALSVLGMIAAFTIPKILTSEQSTRQRALMKDSIAALSDAFYAGIQTDEAYNQTSASFFAAKLQALKLCTANSVSEGCWGTTQTGGHNTTWAGVVLQNGVQIVGLDLSQKSRSCSCRDSFVIDVNNQAEPNAVGQDQIIVSAVYSDLVDVSNGRLYKAGRVYPYPTGASEALYNELFSR